NPFRGRRRVVVHYVVNRRSTRAQRPYGGRGRVVDVNERRDARAVADDWKPAALHAPGDLSAGRVPRPRAVEPAVAEDNADWRLAHDAGFHSATVRTASPIGSGASVQSGSL